MASTPSPKADVPIDKPQSSPSGWLLKPYSELINWKTGLPLGIKEETTLQHGFDMNDFDFEEEFGADELGDDEEHGGGAGVAEYAAADHVRLLIE